MREQPHFRKKYENKKRLFWDSCDLEPKIRHLMADSLLVGLPWYFEVNSSLVKRRVCCFPSSTYFNPPDNKRL